jgi:hypothetical protein
MASILSLNKSLCYLDMTDIGYGSDSMAVYASKLRINTTDSNGIIIFDRLSLTEVQ